MNWFKRCRSNNEPKSNPGVDMGPVRPYPVKRHSSFNHYFLYTLLVLLAVIVFPVSFLQSAPVVFTQADWYTLSPIPASTPPFTGWDSYIAIDNGVIGGNDIQLTEDVHNLIRTSVDGSYDSCSASGCPDSTGGFNAGSFTDTAAYDDGTFMKIALSMTAADGSKIITSTSGISDPINSTNPEQIKAVAVDATYVYTAGFDNAPGDSQWRIEKRNAVTFDLDAGFNDGGPGYVQSNQNSNSEEINAIAIDDNFIYVAGYSSVTSSDEQWQIEKRNITTGALIAAFGGDGIVLSDPYTGSGSERITAIAVDSSYIYVAGYCSVSSSDKQWRIEKRDITTGALIAAFDGDASDSSYPGDGAIQNNPTSDSFDEIHAMAIDATHIYVAGFDNVPGNSQWRIEKRDITTGALDSVFGSTTGIIQNNPSTGSDAINAIAIDDTYIYVAGFDNDPAANGEQWRVEKRLKSTGVLDTANFNNPDGFVISDSPTNTGSEQIMSIAVDADYIFTAGYSDLDASKPVWEIEARDIGTGNIVAGFDFDGTMATEMMTGGKGSRKINAMALYDRYLYVGGYDNNNNDTNERWRLEKRKAKKFKTGPGTFTSDVIDLGGIVNNFNNFSWYPPNQPSGTTFSMDVRGGTVATPDGSWTSWVINVSNDSIPGTINDSRYIQYRVTLNTTNQTVSPYLDQFMLNFSNYSAGAGLESSVFDTGNANNFIKLISWSETLNGYDVRMQVATSGNGSTWNYCGLDAAVCSATDWLDWNASVNHYYTDPTGGADLPHLKLSDAQDDRFFKYKVWLSGDGTGSPNADDISITFDTAHLAVFDSVPASSMTATAGTPFDIIVKVLDSSGASYTYHDHAVTLRLVTSEPQPDVGGCTSSFTGAGNTEFSTGGSFGFVMAGQLTVSGITLCQATETSFTIAAYEASGGALTSNSDLTVTSVAVATPLKLVFNLQPASIAIIDEVLNPLPVVSIQGQYGNVDESASNAITLAPKVDVNCTSDAAGILSADATTVTASSGVAVFSNVSYDVFETIYLEATASGITSACSDAINITDSGYVVEVNAVYDLTNDAIDVTTSFMRKGSIITDGSATLYSVNIQDDMGTSISGDLSGISTIDTVNSVFHTTWDPAGGLTADTFYTIIAQISYNASIYTSPLLRFKVDQLGNISIGLKQLDTTLTIVKNTVASIDASAVTADVAVASLDTKISAHAASQAAYRAQTTTQLSNIKTKIGSILEDTSTTLPDTIKATIAAELAKGRFSEIVTTQAEVKTGTTISFRYRTISGLSPTVTVFDPSNAAKISGVLMKEVSGTGIYAYKITFDTVWGLGNFMIRVDETTKKSVDHIVLNVISATDAAGTLGATANISGISLDTLYTRLNKLDRNIDNLATGVADVKSNTDNVGSDIEDLLKSVSDGVGESAAVTADVQKFKKYISSVSSIIGSSGSSSDIRTIMGKLNGIENTLSDMGIEAAAANDFNQSAKQKADRIKRFVTLIMTEIEEKGSVKDADGKVEILEDYLTELKETVEEIPNSVTTGAIAESVDHTLRELNAITITKEGLEGLMPLVEQELNLGGAAAITAVQSVEKLTPNDMLEMRNDIGGLKSLMLEVRELLDEEVNEPIVHGWLEGE